MPSAARTPRRPQRPNIMVTGTPGTGKTSLARALCAAAADPSSLPSSPLAAARELHHVDVGALVRSRPEEFAESYDAERDCHVLDEDAVLDHLEPLMQRGGVVLDHHTSEWFPERWFQRVIVLRCSTEELWRRLEARAYAPRKIQENVECEIMQVCLDEACDSYGGRESDGGKVVEEENDRSEQRAAIVARALEWLARQPEATPSPRQQPAKRQRRRGGSGGRGEGDYAARLAEVREQIDAVDDALLELLSRRFELTAQTGELKRANGEALQVHVPERENDIVARLCREREQQRKQHERKKESSGGQSESKQVVAATATQRVPQHPTAAEVRRVWQLLLELSRAQQRELEQAAGDECNSTDASTANT